MEWFCTMLLSGMLLAIGWRFGVDVYGWIKSFVTEAPDGIKRIRSYKNKQKRRKYHHTVKRERS